jgi:hypothetical protein
MHSKGCGTWVSGGGYAVNLTKRIEKKNKFADLKPFYF